MKKKSDVQPSTNICPPTKKLIKFVYTYFFLLSNFFFYRYQISIESYRLKKSSHSLVTLMLKSSHSHTKFLCFKLPPSNLFKFHISSDEKKYAKYGHHHKRLKINIYLKHIISLSNISFLKIRL